jgi:succinate dehydrogenase / fumarate reductase cytochrome b subunit
MKNKNPDTRPVYLDLRRIRQPVTAIASIGHRISGVLLFLSIPFVIWMLERSLQSPQGYRQVAALFEHGLVDLLALVIAWAAAHHFFAGIRFLLLDIDIGLDLETARKSAMAVNALGVVGVLVAVVILL